MNISRNYNRGKSFRFSEWCSGIVYKNNDFTQDFVKYKGVLYACVAPFTSKLPDKSDDWELVVDGVGATFIPHVDEDGNLTWTNDADLSNPTSINLKGPSGKDGKDGKDGEDGLSAYQIWLAQGNSGEISDFLNSLKGESVEQTTNWDFWKN